MQTQRIERRAARDMLADIRERKRLAPWRSRSTVLLIEDDLEMRRMLAAALRRDGHRVVEAANGDDALEWLGPGALDGDLERIPDLVVSDIRLPYFTGLEILESLQIVARRIPVVLITAFPDRETMAEAARLGAECVLAKPFELGELRAAVHLALRSTGRRGAGPGHA